MVGGLVDAHLYCDNPQSLTCLSRITDWAEKNLDCSRAYMDVKTEWYTLSENLYRAYLATGGYGPEERLLPREQLVRALSVWPNSCETQCCSWAGFKISKYLLGLTGDARYGDWVERLALNCLGATMPMSPDGRVLYHVS